MSACQTGHQLEVPEQDQDADLAHPITEYESDWESLVQNKLSDNQTQVDRVAHRSLEPGSHPSPPRQAVHSIQTQCWKRL